jgi:deoxyinosine 3'endonuclease (endonuclease V)
MALLQTAKMKRLAGGAAAVVIVAVVRPKLQRWWRRRRWAQEQDRLATLVSFEDAPAVAAVMSKLNASEPCVVAGVALVEDRRRAVAVAVAVELPSLKRVDGAVVPVATALPYEPGYVGFRAAPFLAKALGALKVDVAVALVRGHGFLHPRTFGVACHVGLVAGVSTCGVADSLLRVDGVDEASIVSRARASLQLGEALPIVGASGIVWGAALRATSEPNFRPTYVSAGPGVSLATAIRLAVACRRYRVPEPVRLAELEGRVALRERVVD